MDPAVRFGRPCLAGTRIDVATVIAELASGGGLEVVEENYRLTREQVLDALQYATHVVGHVPPAVAAIPL